ncbi:protein draper-like [Haliotis rufescens]|uniref:protein draper-like n=1 Tax=Haliotis rufescens TaxID=6454 RepID=UPI00201EC120|nr:protein draper-like [Haliotis rufescens]
MAGVVLVTIACLVLSTRADPCRDDQKCSECITASGNCITECDTGYYDPKCKSLCSKNCKLKKCKEQEVSGTEYCTEGCEPGYHGVNCNVGCLVPTENCANCPGGCEEEYCNQGDKCFSGCHDFYFGSDCKNCSSRCESCNRTTGTCDHCHPPYHGLNCEYSCNYSSGSCEAGCAPGLYGEQCVDMCSEKCRSNPAVIPETHCTGADVNISSLCTPECHKESGDCVHGCVAGWYGPLCSFQCNSNCINKRCNITGECAEGCTEGHFGKDCKPCSENCPNYTCISNSGTCFKVCHNGMYGQFCNLTRTLCNDHVCDQPTGKCIKVCFVTEEGCTLNCSEGFPTTERTTESSGTDNSSSILPYAVLLTVVLLVATAVCYACYRMGRSSTSITYQDEISYSQNVDEGEEETFPPDADVATTSKQRNSEHIYQEIDTNEMGPVIVFL